MVFGFGGFNFWKLARNHPDQIFSILNDDPAWKIFLSKPPGGYRSNLSEGEWHGPFKLYVPSVGSTVTIFGNDPEYLESQESIRKQLS